MLNLPTYILITPARNEAQFIELAIKSVIAQTVRPLKWIIVSDGSTDGTDEMVGRYAADNQWIELLRMPERRERHFAGKVHAFNAGYLRVKALPFDVIGNLDGDVSFDDRDYFAFLMNKFAENARLGVAGTPYQEKGGARSRFKSPEHVSGACQMFRRECFEDIGSYAPIRTGGIDLIAFLSAQAKGWETRTFEEKICLHHRKGGSGQNAGTFRRLLQLGKVDYLHGSHPGFEVFRCIYRMKNKPYLIGGVLMLVAYFWAMLHGIERTVPEELVELRRSDQLQRLKNALLHPLRHGD